MDWFSGIETKKGVEVHEEFRRVTVVVIQGTTSLPHRPLRTLKRVLFYGRNQHSKGITSALVFQLLI